MLHCFLLGGDPLAEATHLLGIAALGRDPCQRDLQGIQLFEYGIAAAIAGRMVFLGT